MIHCSPCPGCTCIHVSYSRSCEYSAIPVYAHACVLCMRCDYIFPRIFVRPAIPVYAYVCVHYVCAVRSVMTILSLHVLCMCCDHVSSVHVLSIYMSMRDTYTFTYMSMRDTYTFTRTNEGFVQNKKERCSK